MSNKYAERIQKYRNHSNVADSLAFGYDIVQPKEDGWWCRVEVRGKSAALYSRTGQLKEEMRLDKKAPKMTLIGEFIRGTHRATKAGYADCVTVFDVIRAGGVEMAESMPYAARLAEIEHLCTYASWLLPIESFPASSAYAIWQQKVIRDDAEGLIFRRKGDFYTDAAIGRVKKVATLDYVVMGIHEGKGKHQGRMGALICGLYEGGKLVEKCRVGGGFSDQQRADIWKHFPRYRGKVLEVKGYSIFPTGAMRHPNAVGFREDKWEHQCVWEGQ